MKTLDTSAINSNAFMPIKQGTLDFVANQQVKDLGELILLSQDLQFIYPDTANTARVLSGCYNSGSLSVGGTFSSSIGVIKLNGELFYVPIANFTIVNKPVVVISTEPSTLVIVLNSNFDVSSFR